MTNHSRILFFVWRRKTIVLGTVALFVLITWSWNVFHPTVQSIQPTDTPAIVIDDAVKLNDLKSYVGLGTRKRVPKELEKLMERQVQYQNVLKRMGIPVIPGIVERGTPPPNHRIVHLDLKGAPPKVKYIKRLLPMLKTLGATGVLIEYEDMFPYTGALLQSIPARNAYKRDELLNLLEVIYSYNLTVIPCVQTFAHLEFVLKLREFSQYREVAEAPEALCPSAYEKFNATNNFVDEMIEQIVNFHNLPVTKYQETKQFIHIGCDEVFHIGECNLCRGKTRDQIFLDHVVEVASRIKKKWPHINIIVWDDMLRHISQQDLENSNIGKLVEPMVWVYSEDIYRFMVPQTWIKYAAIFRTAWVASAFKGAHGETLMIPPVRRHLFNTLSWVSIIQSEGTRFHGGIRGIALTGWQRYDHFAVLCELLPTGLPSLAVCLSAASKGYFDTNFKTNPIFNALTCAEPTSTHFTWLDLQKDPTLTSFSRCMFPGSQVFRFIIRLSAVITEAKDYIDTVKTKRGWLTEYNVRHNYSTVIRIDELLEDQSRLLSSMTNLARNTIDAMQEVYDQYTIGEYIEQNLYPILRDVKQLGEAGNRLRKKRTWQQRPLPYLKELDELGVSSRLQEL